MWSSSSANADALLEPFGPLLDKDYPSKGNLKTDFEFFCEQYKVIKCPYLSFITKEDSESIRICNIDLDLSNWRALLLACTVMNSKVSEIYVHNSTMTAQHIMDLSAALTRIGTIKSLRMQFIDFNIDGSNEAALAEAIKALFVDNCGLTFISLTHCHLNDTIGLAIASALATNFVVATINLSNNHMSDATLKAIMTAIRYTGNVLHIAMRNNDLEGNIFSTLLAQFLGGESSTSDDSALKANAKALADKNKAIKDNNKKRKKAGHVELPELSQPEFTRKQGKTVLFANATLQLLDIAFNPLDPNHVMAFAQQLNSLEGDAAAALTFQLRLSKLSGRSDEDSSLLQRHEKVIKIVEEAVER